MEDQQPNHEAENREPLSGADKQKVIGFGRLMEKRGGELQAGDLDEVLAAMNSVAGKLNKQ